MGIMPINKNMKVFYSLVCFAMVAIASCKTVPAVTPSTGASSAALSSVIDHAQDSIGDIKRDAGKILEETATVRQGLALQPPVSSTHSVLPQSPPKAVGVNPAADALTRIDSRTINIIEAADDLQRGTDKLNKLTVEVNQLEKSLTGLQVMLDETKVRAMEKLYGYISMFWVIGFLLIAGGAAVAFFLHKTYGASLAFIGLLMIGFASASQYYMEEIALVGAILLILGFLSSIAMIVWSTVNSKRNATAIREIVEMIQILKETMTDDEQQKIFGVDGVASKVQSDLTKEIIAKIKEQNGFKKLEETKKKAAMNSASSPTV